nr:MAG TPA: hypothetical protein [Caudoviricetes sp.]
MFYIYTTYLEHQCFLHMLYPNLLWYCDQDLYRHL